MLSSLGNNTETTGLLHFSLFSQAALNARDKELGSMPRVLGAFGYTKATQPLITKKNI